MKYQKPRRKNGGNFGSRVKSNQYQDKIPLALPRGLLNLYFNERISFTFSSFFHEFFNSKISVLRNSK